jgi:predicted GH43/DUF377 family glycosyl hydrolase
MRLQRTGAPVIARTPGTFHSVHAANPDVLQRGEDLTLFFRGQDERGRDQIGTATASTRGFDGRSWVFSADNPVIRGSAAPADHDGGNVLDPAAVVWNDRVHVYYTANTGLATAGLITTGLATAGDDGVFHRHDGPVVDGYAPEVAVADGLLHLFFQRAVDDTSFAVFVRTSEDGIDFPADTERQVFGPSGVAGSFDAVSVATGRIWFEGGSWWMLYGGCSRWRDYPGALGLARSADLRTWQRFPGNPVLERGTPGSWDEGAMWFPTAHRVGDVLYVWYEGCGTDRDLDTPEAAAASRASRETDYGGYGVTSFSQVGLATHTGRLPQW